MTQLCINIIDIKDCYPKLRQEWSISMNEFLITGLTTGYLKSVQVDYDNSLLVCDAPEMFITSERSSHLLEILPEGAERLSYYDHSSNILAHVHVTLTTEGVVDSAILCDGRTSKELHTNENFEQYKDLFKIQVEGCLDKPNALDKGDNLIQGTRKFCDSNIVRNQSVSYDDTRETYDLHVEDNDQGTKQFAKKRKKKRCAICDYTTFVKKKLKNHMKDVHSINDTQQISTVVLPASPTNEKHVRSCKFCDYITSIPEHFKLHMVKHSKFDLHTCSLCKKGYRDKSKLKRHVWNKHESKMPKSETNKCETCDFVCYYKCDLAAHMMSHTDEKPVMFWECGAQFIPQSNLKKHMKPYQCDQCSYAAKKLAQLKVHMRTHVDEYPFSCPLCSYKAKTNHLKRHMQTHTGERPHRCQECDFSAGQLTALKLHQLKHTSVKPHRCTQCEYVTHNPMCLEVHLKIHEGQRPYKCEECDFRCFKLRYFKRHQKRHSPYKCDQCPFSTVWPGSFKIHALQHSGVRPYQCTMCQYKCIQAMHLKKHMLKEHKTSF